MPKPTPSDDFSIIHNALVPVLAQAAIGQFDQDVAIDRENPERVNEVLAGVQVLLEVVREKMEELERANARLKEARDRSVSLMDEILRQSLD